MESIDVFPYKNMFYHGLRCTGLVSTTSSVAFECFESHRLVQLGVKEPSTKVLYITQ